ncbi:MAG TPA: hypothetical protein VHL34_24755 [Rhizomicrobium sp.]|nr:hypothetical protein [Rhizomicrobium sp.]
MFAMRLLTLARQLLTENAKAELPMSDREAIRLLTHRINQVGRLNMRLRRAHAALEDALLAVHQRTASSERRSPTRVR